MDDFSTNNSNAVIIGAGNVATHFAHLLSNAGMTISQVYSRTEENAARLAGSLDKSYATSQVNFHATPYTNKPQEIITDAGYYIFAVKDDALQNIAGNIPENNGIWIHTAGSIPLSVFKPFSNRYGVIYPLQTLSKEKDVFTDKIPLFVEGNTPETEKELYGLACLISGKVDILSSEKRKYLHLAAVFACNFTNHMYTLASRILEDNDLDRRVLLPLIHETADKIDLLHPSEAQTGPAIRYDRNVIDKHLSLLNDDKLKKIYKILSESIHETNM